MILRILRDKFGLYLGGQGENGLLGRWDANPGSHQLATMENRVRKKDGGWVVPKERKLEAG